MLFLSFQLSAQKKIKTGFVKFEMNLDEENTDDSALGMMAGTTLDFYFSDEAQRMDMIMMSGMMKIQTIIPIKDPSKGAVFMDMMGQKIQLTELAEDDLSKNNNFMNLANAQEIVYDKKDKKNILGYSCYKANIKNNDGSEIAYYITEKIKAPFTLRAKKENRLKGYPLEIITPDNAGASIIFTATEVSKKLEKDTFTFPEGYTKMNMEEFEKQMGDLGN